MKFPTLLLATIAALAIAAPLANARPADPITARVAGIWKQFTVQVQEAIFKGNPFIAKVQQGLKRVDEQYEAAKKKAEWAKMDETERQNVYLRLALAELREVRAELEKMKVDKGFEKKRRELSAQLDKIEAKMGKKTANEIKWDPNEELLDDEEETKKLAELGELENEQLMGYSMSPKTKSSIQEKTRNLLTDLVSNELKMLTLWMLDNLLGIGPKGKGDPVGLAKVLNGLRVKVMEFVFDVIREVMNQQSGFDTKVKMSISSAGPSKKKAVKSAEEIERERERDRRSKEMLNFINSMI